MKPTKLLMIALATGTLLIPSVAAEAGVREDARNGYNNACDTIDCTDPINREYKNLTKKAAGIQFDITVGKATITRLLAEGTAPDNPKIIRLQNSVNELESKLQALYEEFVKKTQK